MASRMDKYKSSTGSRSSRNKNLYNSIYSYDEYSITSGVASIDKNNEVDISKVKEMLDSREKYQNERKYRNLSRPIETEDLPPIRKRYTEDVTRNYDIRDILNKAKEEKTPDDKERALKDTVELKRSFEKKDASPEEIKELINTITFQAVQNKDDDELLGDLIGDDTKVSDIKDVHEFLEDKNEQTMDNSFFTSSLKISKSDFDNGLSSKKDTSLKGYILIIIFLLILCVCAFFVFKYFMWYKWYYKKWYIH